MNSAGNAAPYSTAGQIYEYYLAIYGGETEDAATEGGALAIEGGTTEEDAAINLLSEFANKEVTAEIVEAVNLQLGLTSSDDGEGDGEGDGTTTTTDGDGTTNDGDG